jgi:aminoglycoside/choline kinase family phosphotransferase
MVHMPRTMEYLQRNLAHPALAPLKAWLERHMLETA